MTFKVNYITLIFIIILTSCNMRNPYLNDETTINIIKLKGENCNFYLKHVVWGTSSDNSKTYISNNSKISDTINDPYYSAIDFFYKLDEEKCELIICKSDLLKRVNKLKVKIKTVDDNYVSFSNYDKKGFENILYK